MSDTPKTIRALLLPDDWSEDMVVSLAAGETVPIEMERATLITFTEVSQLELWHMATEGQAGDGTEATPTFYVAHTGRSLPVGMSP